ncbi:hypothetical protein Syun_009907 [Stephania yunnanensis]|uniref:Uncharacterized protein n=1 Tax=Stephania yunnanensis TaxID=152371 RepID=A0AAP0PP42_9MAGN
MCRGSSQDFKDYIAAKHPVTIVALFGIFSGCSSNELIVPNRLGAIEVDLVPPYQYLTLTYSQADLLTENVSVFVTIAISELKNIDV